MKKELIGITCVSLLLVFVPVCLAGTISGNAMDKDSCEPIPFVTVTLCQKTVIGGVDNYDFVDFQMADQYGFFMFSGLEVGDYKILAGRHDYVFEWYEHTFNSEEAIVLSVTPMKNPYIILEMTLIPIGMEVMPWNTHRQIPAEGGTAEYTVHLVNRTDKKQKVIVSTMMMTNSSYGHMVEVVGPKIKTKLQPNEIIEFPLQIEVPEKAPNGAYIVTVTAGPHKWEAYDNCTVFFEKGQ